MAAVKSYKRQKHSVKVEFESFWGVSDMLEVSKAHS